MLGTPAYMPPEQARGEAVDERADVYAIGAMLYHVLASVPPYAGATSHAILDAVTTCPPRSLEQREPGVPLDLLAIVARAMARDAADRYPTARELAEDLRRFLAGQLVGAHRYSRRQLIRRWLARRRSSVAVAGVSLAILVAVGAFSVRRVLAARELAEQRSAEAEGLMGFMLGDLRERLEPLGKVALLDTVADKARSYYRDRAAAASPHEAYLRGLAHANIADVLVAKGDLTAALAEYRASLATLDRIAVPDVSCRRDRARVHEKLGEALLDAGELEAARDSYREGLAIAELLATEDPSPETRERVIAAELGVGVALTELGDPGGARAHHERALAAAEALVAATGAAAGPRHSLALAHNAMGDVLERTGDLPAALREFGASLAIVDALSAREPGNTTWIADRAANHNRVGYVLQSLERTDEALAEFRTALALREQMVARDPDNSVWERGLFAAQVNIGNALVARRDPTAAIASYVAARDLGRRLADRDPQNADWQRNLAVVDNKIGTSSLALGDVTGAIEAHDRAFEIATRLVARTPRSVDAQDVLASARTFRGLALARSGDRDGARADLEAARAIVHQVLAIDPANAGMKRFAREIDDHLEALPGGRTPPSHG